jgi:hypothetical protein
MAVNAAVLAGLALGAVDKPPWDAIANTMLGPQLTAQSQEGQYHPLAGVVQKALAGLPPASWASVLSARLAWVTTRKTTAETALSVVGVDASLPASLAKTMVTKPVAGGDPTFQWPLTMDIIFSRLWFRLLAGNHDAPTAKGEVINTDQAFAALTDASVVSNASGTAQASARLLLQMRCLADVYARWEMAAQVTSMLYADQLADPQLTKQELLARVLAYARIEGDLSIPPEDDTLQGTDPGAASGVALPPGRTRLDFTLNPSAYLYCVTYLVRQMDFGPSPPGYFVPGFLADFNLLDPPTRATAADWSFTLVLGGLDILWDQEFQTAAEQLAPGSDEFVPSDQFDWPALNRGLAQSLTHEQGRAAAQADYQTRMGLLTARTVQTGPPAISRTSAIASSAYKGPYSGAGANYAAMVVSEGVRYLNRLAYGPTRFGAGDAISTQLPEILVYLWYHTGDKGAGLLSSAAGSALRPNKASPYSTPLKTALQESGAYTPALGAILDSVWNTPSAVASLNLAKSNWDTIAPLLGDAGVVKPLADYIRHEGDAVWKSWLTARANCIAYANLYDYLLGQITGTVP